MDGHILLAWPRPRGCNGAQEQSFASLAAAGLRNLPQTVCQGHRNGNNFWGLHLFITTKKKKCFLKDKNCTKRLLSKFHLSMSSSHDIDKIAISAWKMWQNWVLNLLLTSVSDTFLGVSSFLWECVSSQLTVQGTGELSSQSNLGANLLLKL